MVYTQKTFYCMPGKSGMRDVVFCLTLEIYFLEENVTENSHHVKVGLDIFELVLVLMLLFVSVSRHYPF